MIYSIVFPNTYTVSFRIFNDYYSTISIVHLHMRIYDTYRNLIERLLYFDL